jgi:hypothetical protein
MDAVHLQGCRALPDCLPIAMHGTLLPCLITKPGAMHLQRCGLISALHLTPTLTSPGWAPSLLLPANRTNQPLVPCTCRAALYQRAASRTYLDKSWLDAYYGYKPPAGSGAVLDPPYHKEISTFLYADCIPTPPCSCTGLTPEQPGTQDTQSVSDKAGRREHGGKE